MNIKELLGFYVPSFFEMHLDINSDDLTIKNLSARNATVFFHEYIHYLQDITTIYGLNQIYVYAEYIHGVANRLYKQKKGVFKVPFEIKDNEDKVIQNLWVVKSTYGDDCENTKLEIKDVQISPDEFEQYGTKFKCPSVVIINQDDDFITFGAYAIKESMAYIMERLCSRNGYVKSPEFPYNSAEKVAEFYSKDFSQDLYKVLALCDMSLMSSNPGIVFVSFMQNIKNGSLHFKTPEEIYDYFYDPQKIVEGKEENNFLFLFDELINVVGKELGGYLKNIPGVSDHYHEWVKRVLGFSSDFRHNDKCFLLKMAKDNNLQDNGCWGYCLNNIGTPLMSNKKNHYFKIPIEGLSNGEDVEHFKAMYQVVSLFDKGKIKCDMINWCRNSPYSTYNELCETAPWKKTSESKLCPYAMFIKHWALEGYEPDNK